MDVTAPDGRTYSVRRRWLAWRQRVPLDAAMSITALAGLELALRTLLAPFAVLLRLTRVLPWVIEVRDTGARREAAVVSREHVRGWGPSHQRMRALAHELGGQGAEPPGFPVVVDRDPVVTGDDGVDLARTHLLDDRTAHPTISTLVEAIRADAPWVSVAGPPTTWVLRAHGWRSRTGPPLAVLVLHDEPPRVDVRPVADLSHHVARDGRFHLEYLATQPVDRTLRLIAAGARSLRDQA